MCASQCVIQRDKLVTFKIKIMSYKEELSGSKASNFFNYFKPDQNCKRNQWNANSLDYMKHIPKLAVNFMIN